jgi:hypothetical protein
VLKFGFIDVVAGNIGNYRSPLRKCKQFKFCNYRSPLHKRKQFKVVYFTEGST